MPKKLPIFAALLFSATLEPEKVGQVQVEENG